MCCKTFLPSKFMICILLTLSIYLSNTISSRIYVDCFNFFSKIIWLLFSGVFDNTLDRSDRKISAHATLETPQHRTPMFSDNDNSSRKMPQPILEETEDLDNRKLPVTSSPVITSKCKIPYLIIAVPLKTKKGLIWCICLGYF